MTSESKTRSRVGGAFALALLSCLALAALTASAASALSLKSQEGVWRPDETGLTLAAGSFKAKSGEDRIGCESASGAAILEDEVHATAISGLTFHGCHAEQGIPLGTKCTSKGAESGTIVTAPLTMELVKLPPEEGAGGYRIGFLFEPIGTGDFAEFDCGIVWGMAWSGGVIGEVSEPAMNTPSNEMHIRFAAAGSEYRPPQQYTETLDGREAQLSEFRFGETEHMREMALSGSVTATWSNEAAPEFSEEEPEESATPVLAVLGNPGAFPVSTSWGGGEIAFETETGTFRCKGQSVSGSGEMTSRNEGAVELTFVGCKSPFGTKCTTSGQPEGTIKTQSLPLALLYREDGSPALLLNSESAEFAKFSCAFIGTITISGTAPGALFAEYPLSATLDGSKGEGLVSRLGTGAEHPAALSGWIDGADAEGESFVRREIDQFEP